MGQPLESVIEGPKGPLLTREGVHGAIKSDFPPLTMQTLLASVASWRL